MKNWKNITFISISFILGMINELLNIKPSSVRDIALMIAGALGYLIGAYAIGAILTLLFSLFDRSILKRFWLVSIQAMMVMMVLVTLVALSGV